MNINQSIILKKYICFSIMVLILKNLGGKFYGIKFKEMGMCIALIAHMDLWIHSICI